MASLYKRWRRPREVAPSQSAADAGIVCGGRRRLVRITDVDGCGGRDLGPDDCYLVPAADQSIGPDERMLVAAMQADEAEAFGDCVMSRMATAAGDTGAVRATGRQPSLRTSDSNSWCTVAHQLLQQQQSVHTLKLEYGSGSNWTFSDVDFHYVAHLCAFYAAARCFDRLLLLCRSSPLSSVATSDAAECVFRLRDKNGCSLMHAACWGCFHQVKDAAAYEAFLHAALRSGGAAASRSAAKHRDDFDFNCLELATYLECYQLAACLLELPGVYVQSSVHGNIVTKHYLVDEYIVGSHCSRFHRAPLVILASLATPEQLCRLQESGFLRHPALHQMGRFSGIWLILALELLLWIACLGILYWPMLFSYGFFHESSSAVDPLAFMKCGEVPGASAMMRVPVHAGVVLAKEDVEKRLRYGLSLSVDQLTVVIADLQNGLCGNVTLPGFALLLSDWHRRIQFAGICMAFGILIQAMIFPLRALVTAAVSHCRLKWRSLRYRHLYQRRAQRTYLLFYVCLFCWIVYWSLAAFFNCCMTGACPLALLQYLTCRAVLHGNATAASVLQLKGGFETAMQCIGSLLHLCTLFVNLLLLYMMESAPLFGETIMLFRQVLERFLQLSLIYIICIVIFVNLFWAQTAGILHQVGAEFGDFFSMDLSSFLAEFYRIFATSLNLFDPTTRPFGNSSLTMEVKRAEIKLLHFVYILMFAILTLNFLIAALVSFIDRVARHKSTMHFLHRAQRANRIRYSLWHPLVRLYRLITCNRRKRTLVVSSTDSDRNKANWTDLQILASLDATRPDSAQDGRKSCVDFCTVTTNDGQESLSSSSADKSYEAAAVETEVIEMRCRTAPVSCGDRRADCVRRKASC